MTDVGSTKREIVAAARRLYPARPVGEERSAEVLPGHPMAGKERGGAELAEAGLFRGAMWLFTPLSEERSELAEEWRGWVERMGARTMDMDADRHDELLAWVSHLPQMLSTALAALLEERFGGAPELAEDLMRVGGRALRETTRLGASPYSMWRDVAMTNTEAIAGTLAGAGAGAAAYAREPADAGAAGGVSAGEPVSGAAGLKARVEFHIPRDDGKGVCRDLFSDRTTRLFKKRSSGVSSGECGASFPSSMKPWRR